MYTIIFQGKCVDKDGIGRDRGSDKILVLFVVAFIAVLFCVFSTGGSVLESFVIFTPVLLKMVW